VVSTLSVSTNFAQKIPWKIVLPATMGVATLLLSHLDDIWMRGAGKWDDLPVTSAHGLSVLLNGPVAEFLGWSAPGGLIPVTVFWTCVGWLTDRKVAGNKTPAVRPWWLRAGLYTLGFGLGALLLWHAFTQSRFSSFYPVLFHRTLWNSPVAHLLGRQIIIVGEIIWGLICTVYFGNKLLGLRIVHN
jgi:hypothetical protein